MANKDFDVVPLSTYFSNHYRFGKRLKHQPGVYSTNYFLKHEGKYTNTKVDKKVWVLWAEGRVNGEYEAIKTPIGYLPLHRDLRNLFKTVFDKDYTKAEYEQQFSVRVDKYLEKIARMEEAFRAEPEMPAKFWDFLKWQKAELQALKAKTGKGVLTPGYFT